MSQLFETIKIFNGKIFNLQYHNRRMNNSRKILLGLENEIDLSEFIRIPEKFRSSLVKCKVVYSDEIQSIDLSEYRIRKIDSLKIVECNDIVYDHKFLNREKLDELKVKNVQSPSQDILIVKNGMITDTSYSNVVLFNGTNWFTPSTSLLKGTKRASLLDENQIHETEIKLKDLKNYQKIKLINAIIDLDESPEIYLESVI
ncbi:MAG: hypothetical protein FJ213_10260 [Ignavibacteria bacterium]|nr:hypothetical protein [Ignavibacteria bacterium]